MPPCPTTHTGQSLIWPTVHLEEALAPIWTLAVLSLAPSDAFPPPACLPLTLRLGLRPGQTASQFYQLEYQDCHVRPDLDHIHWCRGEGGRL